MSAPTLFDQLAAEPDRRLGLLHPDAAFCPSDAEILDLWAEHGIPADLSTVEAAAGILMKLWKRHQALLATLDQVVAS